KDTIVAELDDTKTQLSSTQKERQDAVHKLETALQQHSEAQKIVEDSLTNKAKELDIIRSELSKAQDDHTRQLEDHKTSSQKVHEELKQQHEAVLRDLATVRQNAAESDSTLKARLAEVAGKLAKSLKDAKQREEDDKQSRARIAEVESQLSTSQDQASSLEKQLEQLGQSKHEIELQLTSFEEQVTFSKGELETIRDSKSQLEQQLASSREQASASSKELDTLRSAKEEVEKQLAVALKESSSASSELADLRQAKNDLEQKLESLQEELFKS
ncbi:hypothetical protein KCU67_g16349, partial [Aureobasidium melanogenum]